MKILTCGVVFLLCACSDTTGPTVETDISMAPADDVSLSAMHVAGANTRGGSGGGGLVQGQNCSLPHHQSGQACYRALATALGVTATYLYNCARLNPAGCLGGAPASAAAWWNWEGTKDNYGDTGNGPADPYRHTDPWWGGSQ